MHEAASSLASHDEIMRTISNTVKTMSFELSRNTAIQILLSRHMAGIVWCDEDIDPTIVHRYEDLMLPRLPRRY